MVINVMVAPTPIQGPCHIVKKVPGAKKLLVIFSATGTKPGKYNFWKVGSDVNENVIFFRNNIKDWYQTGVSGFGSSIDDVVINIKNWADYLRVEEVVFLGSSQGGYAAALFGFLTKSRVLAFGPKLKLQLPHCRSLKMIPSSVNVIYKDITNQVNDLGSKINIICGEQDALDLYSASFVQGNCNTISVINAYHGVAKVIIDNNEMTKLISNFLYDQNQFEVKGKGSALLCGDYSTLIYQLHCHYHDKDFESAINIAQKCKDIYPGPNLAYDYEARSYAALRDFKTAADIASKYLVIMPTCSQALFRFAYYVRRAGNHRLSKMVYERVIELDNTFARAHYELGLMLEVEQRPELAEFHLRKALSLKPQSEAFAKRVANYQLSQLA